MRTRAPQGNYVRLGDHKHGIGKIGEQAGRGIEPAGSIDHDIAIVIDQQIEEARQFSQRRDQ